MAIYNSEIALVAQITVKSKYATEVYYVTNRDGVTLDSVGYVNAVVNFGDAPSFSPVNGETRTGSMSIKLVNGERFAGAGYLFNNTYGWNNQTVVVRRWSVGITTWSECSAYWSGIIKNHTFDESGIEFAIDYADNRDTRLFPACVIEQDETTPNLQINSAITAGNVYLYSSGIENYYTDQTLAILESKTNSEFVFIKKVYVDYVELFEPIVNNYAIADTYIKKPFKNAPKDFIGKVVPVQFGVLDNSIDGTFAKTVTTSDKVGDQKIIVDTMAQYSVDNLGVYEEGLKRFFEAKKEFVLETAMTKTNSAGQKKVYVKNPEIFVDGQSVIIEDDNNSETAIVNTAQMYLTNDVDSYITIVSNLKNSYTVASNGRVYFNSGEYQLNPDNKSFDFKIDSVAELDDAFSMTNQDGVEYLQLKPGHAKLIKWINEDDRFANENQELMTSSIIRIDNELMLVVEPPNLTNDQICVERGFSDSDIEQHASGSKIYQSPEFSSKNMLIFNGRIDPVSIANCYYNDDISFSKSTFYYKTAQRYSNTKISNIVDSDLTNYFENVQRTKFDGQGYAFSWVGFDIKFPKIESSYKIYSAYAGIKASGFCERSRADDYVNGVSVSMWPVGSGSYDESIFDNTSLSIFSIPRSIGELTTFGEIDTFTEFANDDYSGLVEITRDSAFNVTALDDFNRKWRLFSVNYSLGDTSPYSSNVYILGYTKIYNIGIWVNFLADFTKESILCKLRGRKISGAVSTILNEPLTGLLSRHYFSTIPLLLTTEGGYSASEFTPSWENTKSYWYNLIGESGRYPTIDMSYGIDDDREEIFSFCQKLAQQCNAQIIKTQDGKIDVVDLYKFYNDTSISSAPIELDTVLFVKNTGDRRIKVEQTGTDQIYNDFVVKYQINNKNGDLQRVYTLPQNHIVTNRNTIDPMTIKEARDVYYNGNKKTYEIEAPYITDETNAQRLAEVEALEKCQSHYFATITLDFDHYANINELTEQYKIGQCIYLNGAYSGIRFSSANLWRITNVTGKDQGREIELQCKSMQACHEFVAIGEVVENWEKTLSTLTAPDQVEKSITSLDTIQKVI